jgi:hypothetical protein
MLLWQSGRSSFKRPQQHDACNREKAIEKKQDKGNREYINKKTSDQQW